MATVPDDQSPDESDETEPLETLPEDLSLEDEIRQISRKVNRIMKNVEEANAAIRAIITPATESETVEDSTDPSQGNDDKSPTD